MAQTELDICNRAITRCGGDAIDAIDETTPAGAFCFENYAAKRDLVLGKHRWTFTNKIARLTQIVADAGAPLPYAFAMPADLLGAIHGYRESANLDAGRVRAVQMNGRIYADRAEVWVEYTRRTPENEWPPMFAELVVTAFAEDVARFVQNRSQAEDFRRAAWGDTSEQDGGLFMACRMDDARNAPQRELGGGWDDPGPLVGVRQIGGPWPTSPGVGGFSYIDFE